MVELRKAENKVGTTKGKRHFDTRGSRSLRVLVRVGEPPSGNGASQQQRHSSHGRLPVKQHIMITVIPLASPLHREDLRSIVRRLERVMGTLHKLSERGQNDCCRSLVYLKGGRRGNIISKSYVTQDYSKEDTDMALLTERDDGCQ